MIEYIVITNAIMFISATKSIFAYHTLTKKGYPLFHMVRQSSCHRWVNPSFVDLERRKIVASPVVEVKSTSFRQALMDPFVQ
jgi:hypothetical protein